MQLRCSYNGVNSLSKQCCDLLDTRRSLTGRRGLVVKAWPKGREGVGNVAILGGGITGLATAFFLVEANPACNITIFEASSRLGGWLHSKQVDIGNGNIVFEQGPRNLRPSQPNGLLTLHMMHKLDLLDDVITTGKDSYAAQNRFIYFPDHLVRMPGPGSSFMNILSSFFSEPIYSGVFPRAIVEVLEGKRSVDLQDESVGSFISRRFCPPVADNILSAVLHGIYAGDIYQLSARSIIPRLWHDEWKHGSVTAGLYNDWNKETVTELEDDHNLTGRLKADSRGYGGHLKPGFEKVEQIATSSVFTLKRGIGQLASRLEAYLSGFHNVKIAKERKAVQIRQKSAGKVSILTASTKPSVRNDAIKNSEHNFDLAVSTISGKTLNQIVYPTNSIAPLSLTSSVTVMVVNLFYSNPALLQVHGFGYLLPRSLPFAQNPERALGVVFDSDASIGQDSTPGTKITVMLGGHWWNDWDTYPDEEEGAKMAKAILARHLNITEEPQVVLVGLQKDCIPQYTVGHQDRLTKAEQQIGKLFAGRLQIAGNSYNGVGLNDCVRAGLEAAENLVTTAMGNETNLRTDRASRREHYQTYSRNERG